MLVREILRSKSPSLFTIGETASLQKASESLSREKIGMLLVKSANGHILGTLSERDLVCFVAKHGLGALAHQVWEAMKPITLVASPTSSVTEIMRIMTEQRARHVPVFEGMAVIGVISIGDILHSRLAEKDLEAVVLRDLARTSLALAA